MSKKALRRGPTAPPAARPAEPLQTVTSYASPIEAHMARARLEDFGIEVFLSNEFFTLADGPVAAATGGVQVRVRGSDAARAVEVLRAPPDPSG